VLKRVRNRRAHGFKTPDGPRDRDILEASADILQSLGETAVDAALSGLTPAFNCSGKSG